MWKYSSSLLTIMLGISVTDAFAYDDIEKITIAGREHDLIGSAISSSQGYVSEMDIDVRPLLRVGELLELVPGMVSTQHSGSGKANQYFLRGFNLDHGTDFATFIDGMPVNMRTHGHGQGYTDINFIIPELIKNLAFKKGPYFAELGDFSSAGGASFSLKNSVDKGVFSATVGEFGFQRYLFMNDVSTSESGNLIFAVEQQFYDGPWLDINEDVDKQNMIARYTQSLGEGQLSITAMRYDNSWNSADQIPNRAVASGIVSDFGSIDQSLGGDSTRHSLSASYASDSSAISAYIIDYSLNLYSNFTYFLDDSVNGDQFQQVDERKIVGSSGHHHIDIHSTRITVGFDTRFDDIDEVALNRTADRTFLGTVRSDTVEQFSAATFVDVAHDWTAQLRTNLGIRYDYYDFEVAPLLARNKNGIDLTANSGSENDNIVSVKGNISYQITDAYEMYFSAGQGFHSNDARGTTTVVDPNTGEQISPVDPLVRSLGAELGLRVDIDTRLNASISLWTLSLDSELLFVGDAGNTEASRPSERSGFEITAYYRPNDTWTYDLEYALTDSKFDDFAPEGNKIPGAIDTVIQAGVTGSFQNGVLATLRARYFDGRPLVEDGSVSSGSTTVVNALIGKQWDHLAIRLELLNIFDSDDKDIDYYYSSRLPGEPADGIEDTHSHILEPRMIRITGQYRF